MKFFKRILLFLTLLVAFSWSSACTSEIPQQTDEVIAPAQTEPETLKIDCANPPEPALCCQAMIPACDACREKSRLEVEAWQKQCGSQGSSNTNPSIRNGVDCRAKPTLAQCCTTAEPSCDACRKRVTRLLDMQKKHCN